MAAGVNGYVSVGDSERDLSPSEGPDGSDDLHPSSPPANGSSRPGASLIPQVNGDANGNGADDGTEHTNGHTRIGSLLSAWALVSYGTVQRWGRQSPSCDPRPEPTGEGHPPAEFWIRRWISSPLNERDRVAHEAEAELIAWKRRDPGLNEIKTETLHDLKRRILRDGEGWSAKGVALACRCTPCWSDGRAPRASATPRQAAPKAHSPTPASCTPKGSGCGRSLGSPASPSRRWATR
jgi:hypothetical protein